MSHGEDFAKLLTRALKHEEQELRDLAMKAGNSRQTVKSVQEYYEQWLNVPLVKEALRTSSASQLHWEDSRVDIKFLDNSDDPVATFEIKFKNVPLGPEGEAEITKDFEKQWRAALSDLRREHYCVLVLCGSRQDVESWQATNILGRVEVEHPSIQFDPVPCPEVFALNDFGRHNHLGVFATRVTNT